MTHLHTLCNSQRAAKVIHKGRAMVIRQHPQSEFIYNIELFLLKQAMPFMFKKVEVIGQA